MMPHKLFLILLALAGVPIAAGVFIPEIGQLGVLLTVLIFAVALVDLGHMRSLA